MCRVDISACGSKEAVIAAIASNRYDKEADPSTLLLLDEGAGSGSGRRRKRISPSSLPANYHGFSVDQLRAMCASYGFVPEKGASKSDLLKVRLDTVEMNII